MFTTDEMLYSLLADLENWKANLPENLKYQGPETPQNAGTARDEIFTFSLNLFINICFHQVSCIYFTHVSA